MNKYTERQLAKPGMLVFTEKHGTRYLVCDSKEDFCLAAMHILKERLKSGHYYWDEEDNKENRKRDLRKDKTQAREIVETNDIEAAYEFMQDHSDWEYEAMNIEYPEKYK